METESDTLAGSNKKKKVYEVLKERIIRNELKPSEYLNERVLCKELGMSKTPIREALQHLERNRFVVIIPNKGCFVSNISLELVREVFEIREIHECAAARIAAQRVDPDQFSDIFKLCEALKNADTLEEKSNLLSGYEIHSRIVEAANNSLLTEFYGMIHDHIRRIRVYFLNRFDVERLHETTHEHLRILEAVRAGDASGAEAAMREHLTNAFACLKQMI